MSTIESTYRGWLTACEEGRVEAFPEFLHSSYQHNDELFAADEWKDHFNKTKDTLGPLIIDVDNIMVDEDSALLSSRILIKCTPKKEWFGHAPPEREISFVEMHFVWFTNGKMSRLDLIADVPGITAQLRDPKAEYPFAASTEKSPSKQPLNRAELEANYDKFVATINARTMENEFPNQIHPTMMRNGAPTPRDVLIGVMTTTMAAMPDTKATIRGMVVDVKAQRIASQLELAGTPIAPLAGQEPTGNSVAFNEHVIVEWVDGRIARNWVVRDWVKFAQQLKGEGQGIAV